ncbi:homoserine O-acetyltransferase MetX [Anaeromyxobacter oryzisoli]|uniref:homoserine O-acetyltransferase MetX n=1 Tax=Anaeromyxobacter oryzisoli TaxID=2925408 RepID=UPI001F57FB24|nr:homoserine O-acetyltransferase [Anaeromyxobacter sp. SG63]
MATDPGSATTTAAAGRAAFVAPETRTFRLPGSFELELGGRLAEVDVAYRTWGTLDRDGTNAVVCCHALTGSADADRWWTRMFGPGRALDPERDFIVCSNILGSCYGTTGPASLDPATGRPYFGTFPAITIRDMVRVQHALVTGLGVRRVRMAIGGSLGGMQVLEWALLYPDLVDSVVFIASTARHSAWCIGLSESQRQAIYADPRWKGGRYDPDDPPVAGLAAARMAAMLSYRSQPSFEERFARRPQTEELFAVESYLRYQGRQLVDRFDPATYVTLTRAMDTHDVSRGRGDFDEVLRSIRQPMLVVSIDSDVLYWPWEQREVARLVPNARLDVLDSLDGHDAFLISVDRVSEMVADFRGRPIAAPAESGVVEKAFAERGVSLLVLGKGKVGRELLEQIRVQRRELERDYDVLLRVVGIADTHGAVLADTGVDLARWEELLAAAPATGPVDARTAPALLDRLARLPSPVLVDLTAADGMEEVYEQAFRRGVDVVSSNKRPLAVAPGREDLLRQVRRQHHRHWHYDTAVGASLPVLGTLRRLVQGGDRVQRVEGSLSGTLGYLCTELARGVPLSLATRWAIGLGYCEADARDDLSGLDSARKALILARELGAALALEDVEVEPFVPRALLAPGTPDALLAALRTHDEAMAARLDRVRREGKVLRYLARIAVEEGGAVRVRVGPEAVGPEEPAARLVGVEAFVAFTTARYADRPLVVQGAGVGGANTAGGVLTEIFRIPSGHGAR